MQVAGIELGGTKGIAVLSDGRTIVARVAVPTTTPDETLGRLRDAVAGFGAVAAIGIASFGPIRVDPAASDYGTMLPTPKPGWSGARVRDPFAGLTDGPVAIQTDVTGAAMAEGRWGAGSRDLAYMTVGTGLGIGFLVDGAPVNGLMHPEAGHIRVRRVAGDAFPGVCPFHGDCLEGLASGPAIAKRAGRSATDLDPGATEWTFVADALAEACATILMTLSSRYILIGGGVGMGQPHLFPLVRDRVAVKLGGYLDGVDRAVLDTMIVPPVLGADAGPLGSVAVALSAIRS